MRASEIRNLLIQKFGVDVATVTKILDKQELKQLLLSYMVQQQTKDYYDGIKSNLLHFLYLGFVLAMLILALKPIAEFLRNFRSNDNKSLFKVKLILSNFKKGNIYGGVTLFLSFFLEIIASAMTLSTFLSWILAYNSPYRKYMVPMLSFPINSEMIRNVAKGGVPGSNPLSPAASGGGSGFGIDVGPMLTIMAVNWLVKKFEELSASTVMHSVRKREDKKARKKFREQFGLNKQSVSAADADAIFAAANSDGPSGGEGMTYEEELFLHGIDPHRGEGDGETADFEERENVLDNVLRQRRSTAAATATRNSAPRNSSTGAEEKEETYNDTSHLYSAEDHFDVCATASVAAQHDRDEMPPLEPQQQESGEEQTNAVQERENEEEWRGDEQQEEEADYEMLSRTEQYSLHSHLD